MFVSTLLFLIGGALAASTLPSKILYNVDEAPVLFEQFMQEHGKQYASSDEKQMRLETFKDNLIRINEKNRMQPDAIFGITKFADLSEEEFVKQYTCVSGDKIHGECVNKANTQYSEAAPDSFDWRTKNVVTDVKDQAQCGSCWAFGTTGNLEGVYAIKNKNLHSFSEQQLVDCDKLNHGCRGGLMALAMTYIKHNGIMLDADYPYQAKPGQCRYNKSKVKTQIRSCSTFDGINENQLTNTLVNTAPLTVALDASELQTYRSGIMTCRGKTPNHAVLLVGYGTDKGVPYWLFKNSWSKTWGDKGYFKLRRGVNACGMLNLQIATAEL